MVYLTKTARIDSEDNTQSPCKRTRDVQALSCENNPAEFKPDISKKAATYFSSSDEEGDAENHHQLIQARRMLCPRRSSRFTVSSEDEEEQRLEKDQTPEATKMSKKVSWLLPSVEGSTMKEPTSRRSLFKTVAMSSPVQEHGSIRASVSEVAHLEAAQKVKTILRHFNSYYLRFVQEEENRCRKEESEKLENKAKSKEEGKEKKKSRRPDLKAITQMNADKKTEDRGKILGHVPGINVGDQFFSRCEMVAIGLHCHWLGGIDTISKTSKAALKLNKYPVASSIMLSGAYEDDIDNSEDVIYTGQGGNDLLGRKHQIADQVLKRGNLALTNNMAQDLPVRLIRGHKTMKSYTGKIYTYDGLYKVKDFWAEKGISGFTVYKFRLKRVEGQPILTTNQVHFVSGHVLPASISQLKGLVSNDISNGLERTPIPATNLQTYPLAPNDFRYIAETEVKKGVRKPVPAKGCSCKGECVDPNKCSCAILNKSRFPYVTQNGGRLVEPMDVVYECGPHCSCRETCANRVSQKGMKYRLEVFRTANKGWGVRSWDTIPAGAPVCQYTGILMRTEDADHTGDDVYLFDLDCIQTMKGIGIRQRRLLSKANEVEVAVHDASEEAEYCIDAGKCGNVSRLINHSCEPNLFVQCVLNDHHDLSQPRIWFFAADTIHPLEELSYDYGYEINSVVKNGQVKVMHCYCGAHGCRKRLL